MELTKNTLLECVNKQGGVLHLDEAYEYFASISMKYDSYQSFKGSVRGVFEQNTNLFCNLKKGSGIYALKKYTFLKPLAAHLLEVEDKDKYEVASLCKNIIKNNL